MPPDEFLPIPGHPGYSVARDGRVMGTCGFVPAVSKGKVSLRAGKKYIRFSPDELAERVHGAGPSVPQQTAAAGAPTIERLGLAGNRAGGSGPESGMKPPVERAETADNSYELRAALKSIASLRNGLERTQARLLKVERQLANLAAGRLLEVARR